MGKFILQNYFEIKHIYQYFRKDGIEYRFLDELAKRWTLIEIAHPWTIQTFNMKLRTADVLSDQADFAMGSIWMLLDRHRLFDLTSYFDIQCTTYLVPKPEIVNAATYIYLCMSWKVWTVLLLSFCTIGLILTALSWTNVRLRNDGPQSVEYHDLNRSFLDLFLILTGHGVKRFHQSSAVNCLLIL